MKNKLLIKELNRVGSLMGYDLSKTLTEQKVINNIADNVVNAINKLISNNPGFGALVKVEDGFLKLRISDRLIGDGIKPPKEILELEELVNGNNFDSFNTGFKDLEEFMDSMIGGQRSAAYKKGLFKIFMSDTDMVATNVKKILKNKDILDDLTTEVDISPNENSIDDISEYFFDVSFKGLDLPGHKDFVKQVNRAVNKSIKKETDRISKTITTSGSGVLKTAAKITLKGAQYLFWGIMGAYLIQNIISQWKGESESLLANEDDNVKFAFDKKYHIQMTRDQSEQYQNQQLLSPEELEGIYAKMKIQLSKFDNDPDATANIYGKDSDIKSIIQASQFTNYYNNKGVGNDLVKDMAKAMSIEYLKGGMNDWIKDLAGDIDASFVYDQINGLNLVVGENAEELLTNEEVMGVIFTNLPKYPRMKEEGDGNSYQKWCSTMISGQNMPIKYLRMLSDWCVETNKCGSDKLPWEDKLKKIPVSVLNTKHDTLTGVPCFEVATGEDKDGWPMCNGELARHTLEFDGEQFKQIVTDGLNTLKKEEDDVNK